MPQHVAEAVVSFKTILYNWVKDPKVHPKLKAEVKAEVLLPRRNV